MLLFRRILDLAAYLRKSPLVRTLFVALGFATISLLWLIKPGVEPSQLALYHWSGPAKDFFFPIALDIVVFWLALTLLLLAGRVPGRMRVAIWAALLFFTPWVVLEDLHFLDLMPTTHQWDRIIFLGALIAALLLTTLWRPGLTQRFESTIATASTLLIFAGIFGAFLLCRLVWYGWQASRLPEKSPLHAQTVATIQPHRIIWIVFDELSYQQLYEQRFPGLQLPAFDALAKQATVFTDVVPPGIYTQVVLPGLLVGESFDKIQTSANREPFLHNSTSGRWQRFDQHDTVFQDALNSGYGTAVAGWYNPYCRILSGVVDKCFWTNLFNNPANTMLPSGTVFSNSLAPAYLLASMFADLGPSRMKLFCMNLLHIPPASVERTKLHILDYKTLYAASDRLIRDRSAGFVLLHLPIPHPGGIYDRKTGKSAASGASYIDNLALTDKYLAALRATLEQTGQWNSSTIVIMGDHSWRTKQLWKFEKINSSWTREDVSASHDWQYDPRPAYIVKLPDQMIGSRIDSPYHAINTRKFFDAILAHKINTPADLSAWAHNVQ